MSWSNFSDTQIAIAKQVAGQWIDISNKAYTNKIYSDKLKQEDIVFLDSVEKKSFSKDKAASNQLEKKLREVYD